MDRKLIYFLIGFAAFYVLYNKFILSKLPKPAEQSRPATSAPVTPGKTEQPKPAQAQPQPQAVQQSPASPTPQAPVPTPQTPAEKEKAISVDTPLYHAVFSTRGAVLTSFQLKKYQDDHGQPLEMVPQETDQHHPLELQFDHKQLTDLANQSVYSVSPASVSVSGNSSAALQFTFSNGNDLFQNKFVFQGNSYLIRSEISAQQSQQNLPIKLTWSPGLETVQNYSKPSFLTMSRGLVNSGDKVEHLVPKDEYKKIGSTVKWAGVETNYFLAIFIPQSTDTSRVPVDAYMARLVDDKKQLHNVDVTFASQRSEPLKLTMFIGPKDYILLGELGMDLKDAIDFGFFAPITKALFFTLRKMYTFTHNYGLAIVLITILIKLIFTPFTQMSFASMKKMQQMQPELKKIQDKYAKMKSDDPRKQSMNTEIMALHKRYGVNPLGGCLPMLLQMPVLFAFYKLLGNAIELRGAPFVLWLQDLSRPDPLYITPLIMGVTMLLQQRMTPSTDPMQKNMMYIMPVMFTYISLNLPSGLVLYWLLSNFLAIAHQYYFQQQQKKTAVAVPAKAS
jgi:YidC/Oxa1 family membrane protein insertase